MNKLFKTCLLWGTAFVILTSCQGGKGFSASGDATADTLQMKYASLLAMVSHSGYTEVAIANPWKKGQTLHHYLLVPKGKKGDELCKELKNELREDASFKSEGQTQVVRTPLTKTVVFTSPHCQLFYELGKGRTIAGVCDLPYINIPDIKQARNRIVDCGSSMQPSIEKIIDLNPDALFISPFENSGGFGKLDKLGVPIIETADYMETSPLGRSEWIRFYGLLFDCEQKSDSLFSAIEKDYLGEKERAQKLPMGRSILTERKMGSVWYVPGGNSTIGILLKDAHAKYPFSSDTHSGSLALSPEQVLEKADSIDVWAFKYFGESLLSTDNKKQDKLMTKSDLLQEYKGYQYLKAFKDGEIYECNTSLIPYFEQTSFHPERLLREFVWLAHPELGGIKKLNYYRKCNH